MPSPLVAVEIDLNDGTVTRTLRLCNLGPLTAVIAGEPVQFEPRLLTPILLGASISVDQYGTPIRGAPNGGLIEFALDEGIWPWLAYHWMGRAFRVYEGVAGDSYADLALVYTGRVADLTFDAVSSPQKVTVKTTDASLDLDIPLVAGLYNNFAGVSHLGDLTTGVLEKEITGDTLLSAIESASPGLIFIGALARDAAITFPAGFTGLAQIENQTTGGFSLICGLASGAAVTILAAGDATVFCDGTGFAIADGSPAESTLASLAGLPKPRLWGQGFSLAPILETDGDPQIYRISTTPLSEVSEVRVGGIAWANVAGTPGPGEWSVDLAAGTLVLGSVTLGAAVQVDAKAIGWETLTSAALIEEIVVAAGAAVDAASMADFAAAAPQLIGYYATTSALNTLSVLDEITAGIGGWWEFGSAGTVRAGVIAAPAILSDTVQLDGVDIGTFQLSKLDPPAWRIRIEFRRNWQPLTSALAGVTEAEKFIMAAGGLNAEAFDSAAALTIEPRAVDVPLIRSLVLTEVDAIAIRDRLSAAWGVARKVYDLTAWNDVVPALYDTVSVNYQMVSGTCRVHSAVRSIGGGGVALQLWG